MYACSPFSTPRDVAACFFVWYWWRRVLSVRCAEASGEEEGNGRDLTLILYLYYVHVFKYTACRQARLTSQP